VVAGLQLLWYYPSLANPAKMVLRDCAAPAEPVLVIQDPKVLLVVELQYRPFYSATFF